MMKMTRYLGQREAQHFDEQLMSSTHGFSIDQLMELAGLSVATAVGKQYPTNTKSTAATGGFKRVLVVAGPGNNGGDALVAARHLVHFGYSPSILYPKRSAKPLFQGLVTQCEQLKIPFIEQIQNASDVDAAYDLILDGIFGFSFSGGIRPPFDHVVGTLQKCQTPIVSIDIPSGWHVEKGNESGVGLEPQMLVSLTAPKLCAKLFTGPDKVHYVGGRFVSKSLAEEFNLELPEYPGVEQCVKVPIPY
ncbi:YjeF family domain-containing protein [Phytophthora nicotianae CJ01A1]|uniref:NAD(P)H-hydrate epimerase n=6 Tax=Phytophthora nicotianae TaxID=4792 RepID=W2RCX5_PHYN3|nr:YjeF family domain-containing protein [Phytophthora nicotianae INRA-310]ETI50030.1 YjeF family domain-containing protein [Phytophthora nicotianae P1569]ETK89938.1 YjeF family domain-containing protein [Phytophthora nicotianae]ETO78795.1 YjeF family domain-containing protein [Phytophthora nicotianae P1976]ETP19819.1 YjeF family domain-containing protein [Phytophthora nicotianae CJ01A1]ETP47776.1 YjeF family domain-containing protein [Phytophthora nicotianae P10297]